MEKEITRSFGVIFFLVRLLSGHLVLFLTSFSSFFFSSMGRWVEGHPRVFWKEEAKKGSLFFFYSTDPLFFFT